MPSPLRPTVGDVLLRFLAAFTGIFAGLTLLPKLQWLWLADQLTLPLLAAELGLWGAMVAVASMSALATAGLTFWLGRRRLAAWEPAAPQSGVVFGALAGTLAGLAQSGAVSSQVWSTWLSLTFDLGLRDARAPGPLTFTLISWVVLVATGLLAGAVAVGVLHFPWLASTPPAVPDPSTELAPTAALRPLRAASDDAAIGLDVDRVRATPLPARR